MQLILDICVLYTLKTLGIFLESRRTPVVVYTSPLH